MSLLRVNDLQVYYGSIHAIKGISFEVNEGEIVTLIGANGAGKSTTLNTIGGLLKPRSGSVEFEGASLLGTAPPQDRQQRHGALPRGAPGLPPALRAGESGDGCLYPSQG